MSCDGIREMLGAYVLGALEPEETEEVRRHIETCPACTEEYAQLRPLPGLLDLVSVEEVTTSVPGPTAGVQGESRAAWPLPTDRQWHALVGRAERERSGRRRRALAATAGAVAAAGLLAFFGAFALRDGGDGSPTATPSPTSSATAPAGDQVGAVDNRTGVHATVSFTAVGWGTKLAVELGGVPAGEKCSLIAVSASGRREVASSWQVPASGYPRDPVSGGAGTITIPGAVGMQPDQIDHYEIVTVSGKKLLNIHGQA